MRVLIAFDGSRGSSAAIDLVRAIPWPEGSVLRVIQVDGNLASPLERVARTLERPGVMVEQAIVRGDVAGDRIVSEARAWTPDLLVAGSRGHGPLATALIGSVAVHLAEHAPCPVLIARGPSWERLLFAEDGSDSAYRARQLLATWPIFKGRRVRVVSVAHIRAPILSGVAASIRDDVRDERRDAEMEARSAYGKLALESAEELRIAGLASDSEARMGDPAEEIVAAAGRMPADVVIAGSRGRSPLGRALLGSVAREVLLRAPCSVLVVRS